MIDIILFCFLLGFGYACFWLGGKYKTLGEAVQAIKAKFSA